MDLAQWLGLSQAEIKHCLSRLNHLGLIDFSKKKVNPGALFEFLTHGLRYVFPTEMGPLTRGMPTAYSAKPLSLKLKVPSDMTLVWPFSEGKVRGQALLPLYPSVPFSAMQDPALYELLTLVDALRIGRTREFELASKELAKRLKIPSQ